MGIGMIELLIVFFPMVLLAVGGLVALIAFPKTRRWGIALASTMGILVVLFLVAMVGLPAFQHTSAHRRATATAEIHDYPRYDTATRQNTSGDGGAKCRIDFDAVYAGFNDQSRPVREQAVAGPTENPHGPEHDPTQPTEEPAEPAKPAKPPEAAKPAASSDAAALADHIEEINKTHADIEKASQKPSSRKKASETIRPDWVDAPPGVVDGVYQTTVVVGPYTTSMECNRRLPGALSEALYDYVLLYLGSRAQYNVHLPNDYVLENIVKGTWEENKQTSVGPMKQLHVRLVFDRKTNELIKQTWDNSQRNRRIEERLLVAGAVLACVLGLMLVAFVVLKIDIKTKGAYRKHLALGIGGLAMLVAFGLTLAAAPSNDDGLVFLIGISLMAGTGLTVVKKTRLFGLILLGILLVSLLASID